jgi:hypothetical protein
MAAQLLASDRRADARTLALAALRRQPTNAIAVRTLALTAEADGRSEEAGRLILLANRLSRRDQPTQIWLLRDAIARRDFPAAVRRFDLAMRTSTRGAAQLTPLLIAATADPRILSPLRATLAGGPQWKMQFLNLLADTGPRLDHNIILTRGMLDPAVPTESAVIDLLLARLTQAGQFDLAWQVYSDARRGAVSASTLRNGGFEEADPRPPFDWRYVDHADLAAVRESRPDARGGAALGLIAQNGRSGEVAQQLVRLPPGQYRLAAELGGVPPNPIDRPVVNITCAAGGDPLLALRPTSSGATPHRVTGVFTVPISCRWQRLFITARGGGEAPSPSPWIDDISIQPL